MVARHSSGVGPRGNAGDAVSDVEPLPDHRAAPLVAARRETQTPMPSASVYPPAVSGLSTKKVLSGLRSPTKCVSDPWFCSASLRADGRPSDSRLVGSDCARPSSPGFPSSSRLDVEPLKVPPTPVSSRGAAETGPLPPTCLHRFCSESATQFDATPPIPARARISAPCSFDRRHRRDAPVCAMSWACRVSCG